METHVHPRSIGRLFPLIVGLIVAGLITSFMLITVAGSALLSLLHLPQTAIRWAGIVLLVAVGIGMIVPKVMEVLERPFARLAPRTPGCIETRALGGPEQEEP